MSAHGIPIAPVLSASKITVEVSGFCALYHIAFQFALGPTMNSKATVDAQNDRQTQDPMFSASNTGPVQLQQQICCGCSH